MNEHKKFRFFPVFRLDTFSSCFIECFVKLSCAAHSSMRRISFKLSKQERKHEAREMCFEVDGEEKWEKIFCWFFEEFKAKGVGRKFFCLTFVQSSSIKSFFELPLVDLIFPMFNLSFFLLLPFSDELPLL